MPSIISRVSTNNQIFLNPLQIIDIHNTGHALPNKTYHIYNHLARANWQPFNKKSSQNGHNSGIHKWPKTFLGGVFVSHKDE